MTRIDKYLWAVRLYKTRADATDAVKSGKISVNGHSIKPSYEIHIGDTISKKVPPITYSYKVTDIVTNRQPARNVPLYIQNITPKSEIDKLELIRIERFAVRDKGTGRPTKLDRRRIEEFMDTPDISFFDPFDEEDDDES